MRPERVGTGVALDWKFEANRTVPGMPTPRLVTKSGVAKAPATPTCDDDGVPPAKGKAITKAPPTANAALTAISAIPELKSAFDFAAVTMRVASGPTRKSGDARRPLPAMR